MNRLFHALAHDARRDMLNRLTVEDDLTIGALAQPLDVSFAAASKHVKMLENAGLIDRTIKGREHRCSLHPSALEPASAWLRGYERYWEHRLDALERLIAPENR